MSRSGSERSHRCSGEGGYVGGAEALPLALLVFVLGMLLLANAWAVIDAKMAADSAARETARTFVESNGDTGQAVAAGRAAFDALGRDASRLSGPAISIEGGGFQRCARVTVTAGYQVPAVSLPLIGGWGSGFSVTARHSEIIDPFRSGITGAVQC